ncbi:hypothetical protein [Streptomyces sp. NPDC002133]|uniref:hypothetical protein n=1 Tax=Streptomyces sp. NPDC002133 TaxID=3154409 RepID=UPI00332D871E
MVYLPTIEVGGIGVNIAAYHYGRVRVPVPSGKLDVGSYRLQFGEELLRATRLGGHDPEIVDATLLFAAWSVGCDQRLSPTIRPLRDATGLPLTAEPDALRQRITELTERAEVLLHGAALVSALRALGRLLTHYQYGHQVRPEVSTHVHTLISEHRLRAGRSSALADDAHAHLAAADRVPQSGPLRASLCERGSRWLAAALACAFDEPWSPFTAYRLERELKEHRSQLADLPAESALLDSALGELLHRNRENHDRFEELVSAGRDDIFVYLIEKWKQSTPPAPGTEMLYSQLQKLREAWPSWTSIV